MSNFILLVSLLSIWMAVGDSMISWVSGLSRWNSWKFRRPVKDSVVAVVLWPLMVNNLRKQRQ